MPDAAEPPTLEEQEQFFRGLQTEFGFPAEAMAQTRSTTTFAQLRPNVAGVRLDDQDRLWVAEHDPAARSRDYTRSAWNVYELEGGTGYWVVFPASFHLKGVGEGQAYGISTLETGTHVVDVYRIP